MRAGDLAARKRNEAGDGTRLREDVRYAPGGEQTRTGLLPGSCQQSGGLCNVIVVAFGQDQLASVGKGSRRPRWTDPVTVSSFSAPAITSVGVAVGNFRVLAVGGRLEPPSLRLAKSEGGLQERCGERGLSHRPDNLGLPGYQRRPEEPEKLCHVRRLNLCEPCLFLLVFVDETKKPRRSIYQ